MVIADCCLLLVFQIEVKHGSFCCFYLAEPLSEIMDSTSQVRNDDWKDSAYDLPQALPDALSKHSGKQSFFTLTFCTLQVVVVLPWMCNFVVIILKEFFHIISQ